MSIVKMKRLHLIGMQAERDELLRLLQRMGCVEIGDPADPAADPDWAGLTRPDTGALSVAQAARAQIQSAMDTLKAHGAKPPGFLTPRPVISSGTLFDESTYADALALAERLNELERKVSALHAEQNKYRTQKQALAPWLELDIPLETTSTREVAVSFGAVPSATDRTALEGALQEASDLVQVLWGGRDPELQYLVLIYHRSAEDACGGVLKEYGFSRAALRGWTGTAAENDRRLDGEMAACAQEVAALDGEIASLTSHYDQLALCLDRAAQEIDREQARCRLLDTGTAFYLDGWVPASEEQGLAQALAGFTCSWEARDPTPEEYPQVPVQLKNNLFTRPLNVVTEMYSLPAYDGLDPNPLMAPFFIAFFGIMMADMAYGLIMIAAGLFVLWKTNPSRGTRNFMGLVVLCGISTFIFGAMTGGFFGDFIPQILKVMNPNSDFVMPALFTPLDDTVAILLGSLVLGAIQVFTGMAISVVKKIKDGAFIDALFNEITWWIILAGAGLAIFGIGSVAGVPVVLVAGGLMLVLGGTRQAKGFGKLTSLVGLIYNGVTGFFSDILSYMRLMALMLAGSVIAQVFNTLGSVFGNVIVFVIISLIGNALNLALNLLGCYVHDLRLQCLEYFGRFYKEGGKPFKPLSIQTKYVDISKEEH